MKTRIVLSFIMASIIFCSCGMQKFSIGETSGITFHQEKKKAIYLFWGIVPFNRKQSYPVYADAKGYEITTRYNTVDFLASFLTGGVFSMKTVKFEPKK